jgi:hypothetical protein
VRLVSALVVALVLVSGCASGGQPAVSSDPSTGPTDAAGEAASDLGTPRPEPTSAVEFATSGVPCDVSWVALYATSTPHAWQPDVARVGFRVPRNRSFLAVVFVDGTPAGAAYANSTRLGGVSVDGASVELDSAYSDEHVVSIVAYDDANGNGRFDRGTDPPCLDEGGVVRSDPTRLNFSRFSPETPTNRGTRP